MAGVRVWALVYLLGAYYNISVATYCRPELQQWWWKRNAITEEKLVGLDHWLDVLMP